MCTEITHCFFSSLPFSALHAATGCVQMCPPFLNTHKLFILSWAAPYLTNSLCCCSVFSFSHCTKFVCRLGSWQWQNPAHAWRNPPDWWRNHCSTKSQLVLTVHHPLGLLLHLLALDCATHTAWWICPITGVAWVVCGDNAWELLACVSGSKASSCITSLCFNFTQALYIEPPTIWTSRQDIWSRPYLLEVGRWPDAEPSRGRIRTMENLSHELGLLDLACLV